MAAIHQQERKLLLAIQLSESVRKKRNGNRELKNHLSLLRYYAWLQLILSDILWREWCEKYITTIIITTVCKSWVFQFPFLNDKRRPPATWWCGGPSPLRWARLPTAAVVAVCSSAADARRRDREHLSPLVHSVCPVPYLADRHTHEFVCCTHAPGRRQFLQHWLESHFLYSWRCSESPGCQGFERDNVMENPITFFLNTSCSSRPCKNSAKWEKRNVCSQQLSFELSRLLWMCHSLIFWIH